ncbi:hypothetical protein D3C87_1613370 [compost metagenome]
MHRIGRFVFQGQMWPLRVVDQHRFINHSHRVGQVLGTMQQKLRLQNPVYSLRHRVLIAVIAIGHRTNDPVLGVKTLIKVGAILRPTV